MAWYIAPYRRTTDKGLTQSAVYGPDGTALGPVPRTEAGKPLDLGKPPKQRTPGIVWQRRGKVDRSGWDHYWVWGDGREYLVVETDVTGSGQASRRVVQRPRRPTPPQQAILDGLESEVATAEAARFQSVHSWRELVAERLDRLEAAVREIRRWTEEMNDHHEEEHIPVHADAMVP